MARTDLCRVLLCVATSQQGDVQGEGVSDDGQGSTTLRCDGAKLASGVQRGGGIVDEGVAVGSDGASTMPRAVAGADGATRIHQPLGIVAQGGDITLQACFDRLPFAGVAGWQAPWRARKRG